MTLADKLTRHFSAGVRDRGRQIYLNGHVSIIDNGSNYVEAVVFGSEEYSVEIESFRGTLWFSCSCPYAEANGECKHLWATLLQAGEERLLPYVKGREPVEWRLSSDDEFDEDEFELFPAPEPSQPLKKALAKPATRALTGGRSWPHWIKG